MCHDWLLQRRAQQDARTPEKMKRNQSLVANGNLSLEEKKRKILRCLRRLEGLGVLRPPQTENQILQMIAKVTDHIRLNVHTLSRRHFCGSFHIWLHLNRMVVQHDLTLSASSVNTFLPPGHPSAASAPPASGGGASEAPSNSRQPAGKKQLPQWAGGLLQRLHHFLSGQLDHQQVHKRRVRSLLCATTCFLVNLKFWEQSFYKPLAWRKDYFRKVALLGSSLIKPGQ